MKILREFTLRTMTAAILFSAAATAATADGNVSYDSGTLTISGDFTTDEVQTYKSETVSIVFTANCNIETIPYRAFQNFTNLTSVDLPESVTTISACAFKDCSALKSVRFPSKIESINSNAFMNCSKLTSVTIPASVKSIGDLAFYGGPDTLVLMPDYPNTPTEPNNIYLGNTNTSDLDTQGTLVFNYGITIVYDKNYSNIGTMKEDKSATNLSCYLGDNGKALEFIAGTGYYYNPATNLLTLYGDEVEWDDFQSGDFDSTKAVEFADNFDVNEIGYLNFELLTTINIPRVVETITAETFKGCTSLKNVTLHEGLTTIDAEAFRRCTSLETIVIPSTVTTINLGAFAGCENLKNITLPTELETIGQELFSGCTALTSITLPKKLTTIEDGAFINSGLTSIEFPTTLTSIGKLAFGSCEALKSVTFLTPASINSIGEEAFNECIALEKIELPSPLKTIGDDAFCSCALLEEVVLPSTLTDIGDHGFKECPKLKSVTIDYDETATTQQEILLSGKAKESPGISIFSADNTATLYYNKNYTWIGDDSTQNLWSYFVDRVANYTKGTTSIAVPKVNNATADYYDLTGRKVNSDFHGVVIKVEGSHSQVMLKK